jgi:sucrose-6-phosphate hydrolase SacC (GH32 family)
MTSLTLYYKLDYGWNNAMRLGVLFGFFISAALSFALAIILLIMRLGTQKPTNTKKKKKRPISETHKQKEEINFTITSPKASEQSTNTKISDNQHNPSSVNVYKSMLLMDKTVALEVTLHAINEHFIEITPHIIKDDGSIEIQTEDDFMHIQIDALTKHTSQITIETNNDSQYAKRILEYVKEKESSFLQY